MKKSLYIFIPFLILALMEGVVWMVIKSSNSKEEVAAVSKTEDQEIKEPQSEIASVKEKTKEETYSTSDNFDSESFPPPSAEVKNGRTERTIHIGVRQWAWDPKTITAKKGELVRLIVHNADVKHGLVITDLGVNQDIPPEGAVVEFITSKAGTFEFFCSVYCGEGHMEMRGKIVVEEM